jgi:PAS domain S-box-containing protein
MPLSKKNYSLLVIEDNEGDFRLIQEYLLEEMPAAGISHVKDYKHAKELLEQANSFDAVLLDLSLPDYSGKELVMDILSMAETIPVIVLTGLSDKNFGMTTLAMGIADYLLKDELTASLLQKTIVYSIQRKRISAELKSSEEKYRNLFQLSPSPMWVYDIQSLRFLDVNEAAIRHYGYSLEEFLGFTLLDIRPANVQNMEDLAERHVDTGSFYSDSTRHIKKNGSLIYVDTQSSPIDFEGHKARLVLCTDITEKLKNEQDLILSEQRFKALVQEGSDLVAILDEEGYFRYVSPTPNIMFGYDSQHFINKHAFEFIHPVDLPDVKSQFEQLSLNKRIQMNPFRFRELNGAYHWIETIATNMMDEPSVKGIVINSRDITARIEIEQKMLESIGRYEAVAKATSDAIWDFDIDTQKIYAAGSGYKTLFGYDLIDCYMEEGFCESKVHPDDRDSVYDYFTNAIQNPFQKQWAIEYRLLKSDNSYAYVLNRFSVLLQDDKAVKLLGAVQDITRQKEEEQHLKLLESVITNATDAVVITEAGPIEEPDPKIIYVNAAFTKMTGYTEDEVIGKSPRILQGPKTSRLELDHLRLCLAKYCPCEVEMINYKKDGQEFWVSMAIAPVPDTDGSHTHWIAIERDITNRKIEDQAITRAIINTQESERSQIGLELHDNVNQILAGSLLALGMIKGMKGNEMNLWIDKVHGYIMEAINETRKLSHQLAPATFEDYTLQQSFELLLESMNVNKKYDVKVDFDQFDSKTASADIKLNLYRILQEQLNNIVKYSSAKKIVIQVSKSAEDITMTIKDDGKGFDIAATKKGIGLNNIRKRVEILWGHYNLKTEPGKGCEINVRIPL